MSEQNSDIPKKIAHLVAKMWSQHAAKIEGMKRPKVSVSLMVDGKPGRKKLTCKMHFTVVDETGTNVTYQPQADIPLDDPDQTTLPL
jgi:hypothetical protein